MEETGWKTQEGRDGKHRRDGMENTGETGWKTQERRDGKHRRNEMENTGGTEWKTQEGRDGKKGAGNRTRTGWLDITSTVRVRLPAVCSVVSYTCW